MDYKIIGIVLILLAGLLAAYNDIFFNATPNGLIIATLSVVGTMVLYDSLTLKKLEREGLF